MATYYSSLYEQAPNRGSVSYIARSPSVTTRAQPVTEFFTFTIPTGTVLATNDVIKLIPGVPGGARVSRFAVTVPGYDGGAALVANVGWASGASGAGLLSGLTTLRSSGTVSATDANVLAGATASGPVTATTNGLSIGAQDELQITITTGSASAGTNGAAQVLVELIYP